MKQIHDKHTLDLFDDHDLDAPMNLCPTSTMPCVEPLSPEESKAMHAAEQKPRGRGRPKQYGSQAEKQRAYRLRQNKKTFASACAQMELEQLRKEVTAHLHLLIKAEAEIESLKAQLANAGGGNEKSTLHSANEKR